MPDNENARPVDENRDGRHTGWRADTTVADWRAAELRHARRRLDEFLGVTPPPMGVIDYDAQGFTLGIPERRELGLAILQRERAA